MKKYRAIILGLISIGVLVYISCRKIETNEGNKSSDKLVTKFFESHSPSDTLVLRIADLLKRENKKYGFLERIISKIGFPYWDKARTFSKSDLAGLRGDDYDTCITMIPFVRDSQYYVNAVLLFKTSSQDFSFQFLCDWQYANYGFDTAQEKWDARSIFHIFSEFEKSIFDHRDFIITDTRIFGDTVEHLKIELYNSDSSSGISGRPAILSPVTICTPYRLCHPPCLAFRTSEIGEPVCCFPTYHTFCTTFWVDDGWIPVNGGQGGGDPSGGGSDGGYTPPNCPGGVGRPTIYDPCTSGWYPIPLAGEEPPTGDPIDSLLARYSRALRDTAVYIYDNLSQPNNIEHALTGVMESGLIKIIERRTNNDSTIVIPQLNVGRLLVIFVWHAHVSRSGNLSERRSFSSSDIELLRHFRCLRQDFVSFADCRNKRYALVISDATKATAFFNSHDPYAIESLYTTTGSGNIQEIDERCVKNVIGSVATNGIGFYVSNDFPNFQSWTLLNQ